jgi:indolepyruvate ferredoxin oxidoreductase beta subunit
MTRTRKVTNILIVGVGGQGIVLASEIIASVCLKANLDVKQSEVHGMAQRGGIVSSQVRFGDKVFSPTIERGRADILLSFELLEALRWIDYLHPKGMMIVNNQRQHTRIISRKNCSNNVNRSLWSAGKTWHSVRDTARRLMWSYWGSWRII